VSSSGEPEDRVKLLEDADPSLLLDEQTVTMTRAGPDFYIGHIDIVLHPIFLVPFPFISMHDRCGQPVDCLVIQDIIDSYDGGRQQGPAADNEHAGDLEFCAPTNDVEDCSTLTETEIEMRYTKNRVAEVRGRLCIDEHPILGTPCLSLHLCELPELMRLLTMTSSGASSATPKCCKERVPVADSLTETGPDAYDCHVDEGDAMRKAGEYSGTMEGTPDDNATSSGSGAIPSGRGVSFSAPHAGSNADVCVDVNDDDDGVDELYVLRWLSLVGPSIGLKLTPAAYKLYSDALRSNY
jgi:hypothetical protein